MMRNIFSVFHASCIEQWLLMRGNCPNCRAQVADDTLHESEEENDIERTAEVEEGTVNYFFFPR